MQYWGLQAIPAMDVIVYLTQEHAHVSYASSVAPGSPTLVLV